jgi:hypothetical protein
VPRSLSDRKGAIETIGSAKRKTQRSIQITSPLAVGPMEGFVLERLVALSVRANPGGRLRWSEYAVASASAAKLTSTTKALAGARATRADGRTHLSNRVGDLACREMVDHMAQAGERAVERVW